MLSIIQKAIITIILSFTSGVLLDKYRNSAPKILCTMKKSRMNEGNNDETECNILKIKNISKETIQNLNINIKGEFNDLKIDDAEITNGLKFTLSSKDNVYDVNIPFLSKDDEFLVNLYTDNTSIDNRVPTVTLRSPQKFKQVDSEENSGFISSLKNRFISKKRDNNLYLEDDLINHEVNLEQAQEVNDYQLIDDNQVRNRTHIITEDDIDDYYNNSDTDDFDRTLIINQSEIDERLNENECEIEDITEKLERTLILNTSEIIAQCNDADDDFNYDYYAEREEVQKDTKRPKRKNYNRNSSNKTKDSSDFNFSKKEIITGVTVVVILLFSGTIGVKNFIKYSRNIPQNEEKTKVNIEEPIKDTENDYKTNNKTNDNSSEKIQSSSQNNISNINQSSSDKNKTEEENLDNANNKEDNTDNKENETINNNNNNNNNNNGNAESGTNNSQSNDNNNSDKVETDTNKDQNSQSQNNNSSNNNNSDDDSVNNKNDNKNNK